MDIKSKQNVLIVQNIEKQQKQQTNPPLGLANW